MRKSIFYILTLLLYAQVLTAQLHLTDVRLEDIRYAKVREYIEGQIANNTLTFQDIQPSLTPESELKNFAMMERSYLLKGSVEEVWNHYINTPPSESWNSQLVKYSLLYSGLTNQLYYSGEYGEKLSIDEVIYLNIRFLYGVMNLALAFQITEIDSVCRIIELSYIKGNITEGKQQILFFERENRQTQVIHRSYFKSSSFWRDHLLYPFFHARVTGSFHRNMRRKM